MTTDEQFIRRAIRLAMNGRGKVEPNPMVGCVLVRDGRVIGEGYHTHFGGPHAEPTALASCTESPEGATAYVTLEPCCHTNKKTPPCAPRLIREKIARVVVGCLDPNREVNGNGLRMLREAGVQVDGPVLEAECKQLIAPFLGRMDPNRVYTTVKWAESADGRVAGAGGQRVQISNAASTAVVQQLRSRSGGILVGINTVLNDDPMLVPRGHPVPRPYTRFVLDTHLRTPLDCQLVRTAAEVDLTILCARGSAHDHPAHAKALREASVDVRDDNDIFSDGRLDTWEWYEMTLCGWGITHLLAEPGPTLAATLLPYVDRLWVIRSPNVIGGQTAPHAVGVPDCYVATGTIDLDGDRLTEYLNTRGEAFFAPVPSADFVLTGSSRPAAEQPAYADPPA